MGATGSLEARVAITEKAELRVGVGAMLDGVSDGLRIAKASASSEAAKATFNKRLSQSIKVKSPRENLPLLYSSFAH